MKKVVNFLKKSVLFENPVLSLFAGITPLLATSTKLLDGVFMGLCAIICIFVSSLLFRVLRRFVPNKLRDIVYILACACVVSLCEILLRAFLPSVYESLGIYLPLLCVSGLVFSRSRKFEKAESIKTCMLDAITCGIGFFVTIVAFSLIRELFGRGTVAGFTVIPEKYAASLLAGPVGGFILLGILVAVCGKLLAEEKSEEGRE